MARRNAAIAAVSVLTVMAATLLLLRSFQSRHVVIYSYTDDAGGLSEGTPVRLNGISVGELDKLHLTNSRDPKRKIEFVMKMDRRFLAEIPDDSVVGEAATNLLGNYFINIIQGVSHHPVQPGGELRSTVAIDPNKLMGQMGNEFQEIQAILTRAEKLLEDVQAGQGNIGMWSKEGLGKVNRVSKELNQLTADISNGHGNLSKIDDLGLQMDSTGKRLDDLVGGFQAGQGTAGKLQAFSGELQQMNREMTQLTADLNSQQGPGARLTQIQQHFDELNGRVQASIDRINSGQGTLGQLTVNTQFSEALAQTGANFQALAKDIRANPRKFLSFQVKFF
jgi:phospholipid/cholesterol/gamma-HCH transport system substrate-binding protein